MGSTTTYDLVIIGAGSAGLTAADFATQLGAKVGVVEKERIGGDCTWSGCVPSKALLKVAKVANELRVSAQYGVACDTPKIEMAKVRAYVQRCVEQIYQGESPEKLRERGMDVFLGQGEFVDAGTFQLPNQTLKSKSFLICTGAHPFIPPIAGLQIVPFWTYEQIFENDQLPNRLIVIGAGPVGVEIAQAYQHLGSQVTLIGEKLLPKEEPEAQAILATRFQQEGMKLLFAKATAVRQEGQQIIVNAGNYQVQGDALLIATGRRATVEGFGLEKTGVQFTAQGIAVDRYLRTNIKHIYAAGDVIGSLQFTHLAAWQAFQAARNSLLPGFSQGVNEVVPWVTFTQPEIARAGTTEAQARQKFGPKVQIHHWQMNHTDRAICENATNGFIKLISKQDGTLLGATIVAKHAGELISEIALALNQKLKLNQIAATIHPYPTYATAIQQLTAQIATKQFLASRLGNWLRTIKNW